MFHLKHISNPVNNQIFPKFRQKKKDASVVHSNAFKKKKNLYTVVLFALGGH